MSAHHWPAETKFRAIILEPTEEERPCETCSRLMRICDHRRRNVFSFASPLQLTCKLFHCVDKTCPASKRVLSPRAEMDIAPPRWIVDWEVFAWMGHRRFARHLTVPQIRADLADHKILLSDDAVEFYLARYAAMLAARQSDLEVLREEYRDIPELALTIDGLQPEKGHETLYVVRELHARRVWFAEPLLSSAQREIDALLVRARDIAAALDRPVRVWESDKQDGFVHGIAEHFPGVPHRFCKNHFVRAVAKEVLATDSHVKVQMRHKVRGLREIEREVLAQSASNVTTARKPAEGEPSTGMEKLTAVGSAPAQDVEVPPLAEFPAPLESATPVELAATPAMATTSAPTVPNAESSVVLDYCAAVRGILTSDQGDALNPTGLRMASALEDVQQSLIRCLAAEKGGLTTYG